MKNSVSINEGSLNVVIRPIESGHLISVMFDGELVEQYATSKVMNPKIYAHILIESFQAVMRDSANVPDLNEITYV
jgi:hypothetical protein